MSKAFLETLITVTLDRRKYSESSSSYTVGQVLRFFIFPPKCINNLCKTKFSVCIPLAQKKKKLLWSVPCIQNWLGKFCLQRGFMHSCIILQMGLVFPYLQWREAWKNCNGSFGYKGESVVLVAWGFKKLTEVFQFFTMRTIGQYNGYWVF